MPIKERLQLAARGDIFTIVTPWARMTNTRDFFLACFEDVFLNLKIKSEHTTDDGRIILTTEEKK